MNNTAVMITQLFFTYLTFTQLSIATYNSHGHAPDKLAYINKLSQKFDFILIQEHWLMESQLNLFQNTINNIRAHGVSGMNSQELLVGRPYGGVAILWRNAIMTKVVPLSTTSHRVCAVKVSLDFGDILICNVYMPCDNNNDKDKNEFQSVLSEISNFCQQSGCNKIIIGCDLNTDLSHTQSYHTTSLFFC